MADSLILTPGQVALPDDFRAVLQQHADGGNDIKSVQPIPVTDPKVKGLLAEDGFDFDQTPPYRYYLGDGSMVEAVTQQDGSYRIIDYKPSQKFQQAQAQANKPQADPNSPQGRAAAANATTDEIRATNAQREATESAANAALPPDQDPRYETNAQRAARAQATIRQQGQDARAAEQDQRAKDAEARTIAAQNRPGAPTLKPDGKGGTIALQTMPDGSIKQTPLPGVPSEAIPLYSEVKQDPASSKWYGLKKDGSAWVEIAGGPGTGPAGNQGPPLPVMVAGQMQTGLRQFGDQLNSQVQAGTITPAIADKRWGEATQVAELGIKDATEQHNEDQSRRNADVQIRTNALTNSTSGFNSALEFVAKLNGSLPKGSTAGGEALAAILGLQQLQARRLGAFDNQFSGASSGRPAPPPDNTAPGSAIGTAQPATGSAIGTATPPPGGSAIGTATPPAPPAPAAQNAAAGTGEPPARGSIPAAPGGDPPPAAVAIPPGPTFVQPDGSFGIPGSFSRGPDQSPGNPDELVTITSNTGGTLQVPRSMVGDGPGQYGSAPERGGYQIAAPQSMAAPSAGDDFAAMRQLGEPVPPPTPGLGPPDPGPDQTPPALAHALAASKPPWQMSDQELQGYLDAGVPPEVVWGVPGRAA